jgi:hypothetical protein
MPVAADCPFCNASTILASESVRVVCRRCGESFAPSGFTTVSDPLPDSTLQPTPPPRINSWRLLAMIAVGLAIAAYGVIQMVKRDPRPIRDPMPELKPNDVIWPTPSLAAWKSIHPESNIVAALQPAAMIRQNASDTPAMPVVNELFSGLKIAPDAVDHMVLGVAFAPTRLVPGMSLAVVFRSTIDESALFKTWAAERKPIAKRVIYNTNLKFLNLPLVMTPIDARTVLFGLSDDDLAGADGKSTLPATIRQSIQDRLSPASWLVIASDHRDWSTMSPIFSTPGAKDIAVKLATVRAFVLGVSNEPDWTLTASLDTAGDAGPLFTAIRAALPDAVIDGSRMTVKSPGNPSQLSSLIDAFRSYFSAK